MNLRETKMKLEVKTLGDYSLHVILPKKECGNIKEGDLIEVEIDGKTTTAPQFDPSLLEKRIEQLEYVAELMKKEKATAAEAQKAEKLRIANKQADDDSGFSR